MVMQENPSQPRFIIGIDLGTTNCAVAYVDTKNGGRTISDFPIRQFTDAGISESRDTLPSFLYALTENEATGADHLIDQHYRVGVHARDHGTLTPGRLIASAKSWLCHAGVDRKAAILPWHAVSGVKSLSPIEAQSVILKHLVHCWNEQHPEHPFAAQEIYITVPASFDEVARELTVEAAKKAGIPSLVLIEEPQAAFYAWLSQHEKNWSEEIKADDHILICDVGGGTTDFTLIHAKPGGEGLVEFHRTAVGDHLILGGDNLDLALAHSLEHELSGGTKLDARSWSMLVRKCRYFKEHLLSDHAPDSVQIVLPGTGSGLLKNQRQANLVRQKVESLLLDGFMPRVQLTDKPVQRSSGFQEFGLPFAADHAITRYLADFLWQNLPRTSSGVIVPPKAILLNGGLFESSAMRRRLYDVLNEWFSDETIGAWSPQRLDHRRLDLAVARGASYFGIARRGLGVKIVSHLARSYYIGIGVEQAERTQMAMCIAPSGMNSGQTIVINQHPLQAQLKTPVEFPLFVSSRRTMDTAGELIPIDESTFTPVPPVRTVLGAGKQAIQTSIRVHLKAELTELGTLDLSIVEVTGGRSWRLDFDLRAATRTELNYHRGSGEQTGLIETDQIQRAVDHLKKYFALNQTQIASSPVIKDMEQLLELSREEWPVSVLREFWKTLMECSDVRKISAQHEQRWLNLTGYCLRPGAGLALDDWRVSETWKLYPQGICYPSSDAVRAEWWILWRRIAGGMTVGQQKAMGMPVFSALKGLFGGKPKAGLSKTWDIRFASQEFVEILRMISSLENLDVVMREQLGEWLIKRMSEKGADVDHGVCWWALGRIGSRIPLYGSDHLILSAETVGRWIRSLCAMKQLQANAGLSFMSLGRLTGDRYHDVADDVREEMIAKMKAISAPDHLIKLVAEGGSLDHEEQNLTFGEKLPRGLHLLA